MRVCNKCFCEKEDIFFNKRQSACKECQKEYNKFYQTNNIELVKSLKKDWRSNNKDKIREYKKSTKTQRNKQMTLRRKNDVTFKIRQDISRAIRRAISHSGSSKNGKSTTQHLNYTIQELKQHIEIQFESWMTWQNQGRYVVAEWNDADQSTWTWQIDHIIPQSALPYSSMEDENFKKCWALENLRPLSSKHNLIKSNS